MEANRARIKQQMDAPFVTILTLEGEHVGSIGDWIIQGVAGELYPCKPDIFQATYEAVEDSGVIPK